MLDRMLQLVVQAVLSLRYRVRVIGLDRVAARGTGGILFLPNHPALIDPVILVSRIVLPFRPRILADQDQVNRPIVRWLARRAGIVGIPDVRRYGPAARDVVAERIRQCLLDLTRGRNLLLYPSGHIYRTRFEDLRGNSAVESAMAIAPDARVVLVRTRGLWGSCTGMASGEVPNLRRLLWPRVGNLLANFLFWTPRRDVTIELFEPPDFPRSAGREEINRYLERFYNEDAPPARYVPYTIWEAGGPRDMPEPDDAGPPAAVAQSAAPESVRRLVVSHLVERSGVRELRDDMHLARDLGLDSLARTELLLWIGKEFGHAQHDPDSIQTVGDVVLAACGEAVARKAVALKAVPRRWFIPPDDSPPEPPDGDTVAEAFLAAARRRPGQPVIADQMRGVLTYRDLVTAILVLKPALERLAGERVGILLPASCGASIVYLATLFAEKTPVMVNWTTGARNMLHGVSTVGARCVLTSRALVGRLAAQGVDFASLADRFVYLEDVGAQVSALDKLDAAAQARLDWGDLRRVQPTPYAVILFTSGSEAFPKAVPLTHANILANIRDVLSIIRVRRDDALVGFLPPFHSFGISVTTILPLVCGLRAVYHPNPNEAWVIAKVIEAYRPTVVLGTPTFLSGIVRAARPRQLASLRLAITGAEKCPDRTYELVRQRCPGVTILEGYGVTECAPIVSATPERRPIPGTIGRVLPSMEYVIVDPETGARIAGRPAIAPGETERHPAGAIPTPEDSTRPGMLLVRGPNVFPGYLGDAPSPFAEFEGRSWYRTGDLVSSDADGTLTFRGRLKRFVKVGGEMISLPAIEAAIEAHVAMLGEAPTAVGRGAAGTSDEGPTIAVECCGDERPEIVLFTTRPDVDRAAVNRLLQNAGLSPLHNVTRVVHVAAIPVLGTGKTDYRALRAMLAEARPDRAV